MPADSAIRAILVDRLAAIESRIAAACQRANRERSSVALVAVTKTVSPQVASLLPELGLLDLGENRPQELWRKAEALHDPRIRWHFIGHLQRNKVERTLPQVCLFHTVDSQRLLEEIASAGTKAGIRPQVLLQINASREEQKHGFDFDEVVHLQESLIRRGVDAIGLMGMAAYADDPERARPAFRELRELRDRLRTDWGDLGQKLHHLSMGMSGDFEVAIEEGATIVRIGSTLFDGLETEA